MQMPKMKEITFKDLQPDDIMLIKVYPNDKIFEFKILEIFPEIAKVEAIFPRPPGYKTIMYFEKATVGKYLKVYSSSDKNGYMISCTVTNIAIKRNKQED